MNWNREYNTIRSDCGKYVIRDLAAIHGSARTGYSVTAAGHFGVSIVDACGLSEAKAVAEQHAAADVSDYTEQVAQALIERIPGCHGEALAALHPALIYRCLIAGHEPAKAARLVDTMSSVAA